MAKKLDPKAKAKRDKVIAGVAGGVLLVVLAITLPMTLKMMKPQNAASAATAPATTGSTPTTPVSTAAIASGSGAPAAGLGQLDSFSRFDSKDPFHQQVDPHAVPDSQTPVAGGPTGSSPSGSGSSPPSSPVPTGPTATPPPPTAAVIAVNDGPPQRIAIGQDFPLAPYDPIFHLVSVSRKAAKISIAGGSLSDGRAVVTLRKGRPLTLMNTADGTQYELRLLWTGSGAPPVSILPPTATTGAPSTGTTTTATTTTTSKP
jgi:hypothetical protein